MAESRTSTISASSAFSFVLTMGVVNLFADIVAGMLPEGRRNLAFRLFHTGYGVGWLVGSVTTGLLYERSIAAVIVFSVVVQLVALPVFALAQRVSRSTG